MAKRIVKGFRLEVTDSRENRRFINLEYPTEEILRSKFKVLGGKGWADIKIVHSIAAYEWQSEYVGVL